MKISTLYFYTDSSTQQIHCTLKEQSPTSSRAKYWLTAEDGCYLKNNKYNISCKSIIVPTYELNDWVECQL